MERGVVVGGLLVSVSLLLAVMLNNHASREARPIGSTNAAQTAAAAVDRTNSGVAPASATLDDPGFNQGEAGSTPPARAACEPGSDGKCRERTTQTERAERAPAAGEE